MKTGKNKLPAISLAVLVLCALLLGTAPDAAAVGTPAGTDIQNRATVTFTIGATNFVTQSNVNIIRVAELINVTATWQDAAPVTVIPGQTGRITNTGNGNDAYVLAVIAMYPIGGMLQPAINTGPLAAFAVDNKVNLTVTGVIWGCLNASQSALSRTKAYNMLYL